MKEPIEVSRHQVLYQGGHPAFVVVPFEDYQRAGLEGLLDSDAGEHYIPHEVVTLVVDGLSPIAAWRQYKKISQTELAERMGIKQPSLADMEKSQQPRRPTLQKAAEALGIHIEQLDV